MGIGNIYKNRIVEFKDEEFGYRIIKPVEQDLVRSMYFTSNPFLMDNEHIIISAVRNGIENYYLFNYKTGEQVQLTDEKSIDISRSYFDRKKNLLYYTTNRELKRVDVFTLKTEELYTSKTDMHTIAITCDGKHLVTSCVYDYEYKNNDGHNMVSKMWRMFAINLDTGKEKHILFRNFEIDHIQCSPVNPNEILFCARGYYATHHRIWKTNLDGTNGGALGPEQPNEHRTHEYYTPSGRKIAYHGKFFSVDENLKFVKTLDTFGIMDTDGTNDRYYKCPKGFKPIHSCMSPNEDMVIADGPDFLSILSFNEDTSLVHFKHIYRHNSSLSSNFVHPHPSISNNSQYVVFATDMGQIGKGNIYLLDLNSK